MFMKLHAIFLKTEGNFKSRCASRNFVRQGSSLWNGLYIWNKDKLQVLYTKEPLIYPYSIFCFIFTLFYEQIFWGFTLDWLIATWIVEESKIQSCYFYTLKISRLAYLFPMHPFSTPWKHLPTVFWYF